MPLPWPPLLGPIGRPAPAFDTPGPPFEAQPNIQSQYVGLISGRVVGGWIKLSIFSISVDY
jgi:hypothetical protein